MLNVLGGRRYANQSADGSEVTGRRAELKMQIEDYYVLMKKEIVIGLRTVVLT
jgi:hypothetical protein